ncbi:MAG TPA: hypothetical protein VNJ11_12940 [Bryobacteraceae bacterium]|nr:hypothetical protein [Bryobacteraceae bacterium]
MFHQFRQRADVGGDHRRAGGKGLDDYTPERFLPLGRTDDCGGLPHELLNMRRGQESEVHNSVTGPRYSFGQGTAAGHPERRGAA